MQAENSVFYQGTNVPAVQAFENHINLEKQKQEQDTDMNVIDIDCSGSGADASSYFCNGGHRRIFFVLPPPTFSFKPALHHVFKQQK